MPRAPRRPPAGGDEASRKFRSTLSRAPDQTEAQLRDMTSNYYGMISLIDHSVGRLLATLLQVNWTKACKSSASLARCLMSCRLLAVGKF